MQPGVADGRDRVRGLFQAGIMRGDNLGVRRGLRRGRAAGEFVRVDERPFRDMARSGREVERLARRPERKPAGAALSARNRFPGVVRSVESDGVMALVEIEAGPHRITAAVTRDAVRELGLAPGVPATATVKATSVMVERGA